MKISEMSTIQAASALAKLSGPLSRLLKDGKLKEVFENLSGHKEDMNVVEAIADVVDVVMPMLFEEHATDTFTIVSIMCGKPIKEVSEQKFITTMNEIREFAQDREFIDFLASWRKPKVQNAEE